MNSFLINLKIKESSFSGMIISNGKKLSGSFKRIYENIFIVRFKSSVDLRLSNETELISRNKTFIPILPVLIENNKKKLTKVAKIIVEKGSTLSVEEIIDLSLQLEKVLEINKLRDFVKMNTDELRSIMINMEIGKKVKVLNLQNLYSCSYKVYRDSYSILNENLSYFYNNRIKTVRFSELTKKSVLKPSSFFFKYLLGKASDKHSFKIMKDKVVFTQLPITEKEALMVDNIEKIIKKNKLGIFSILSIKKVSDLENEIINNSLWHMLSEEKIVALDEKREYFIFKDELTKIINRLKKFKRNQDDFIDISSFREITVLNRKGIIVLFEYLDSQKITTRTGNKRKIELQV